MSPFWNFARRMLRYRRTAAGALTMAFVSAGGVGAGLVALVPVLKNILGENQATLRDLAQQGAARLTWLFPRGVPPSWMERLPEGRFEAVMAIVIGLGVLTVIGAAANYLHAYLSLTITTRTVAQIRRAAFKKLVRLPLAVVVKGQGSDFTSRILFDANVLSRGFQALTSKAISHILRGSAALGAALIVDWRMTLATSLAAPVLYLIIRKLGKRIRRASKGAMRSQARLLEDANEVTRGFRVVKVFTSERAEIGRFTRHNQEVVSEMFRLRTAQAFAGPLMETISVFIVGGLALVAAKAIIDDRLDPTHFLVTLAALAIAGGALRPLTSIIQDIQTADAAAKRLDELISAEPEERRTRSLPRLARHRRSIEFKDVSFAYEASPEPAVDGVNLVIAHGETVAFVGPNGCGKTTLLSLVPRLFPVRSGSILIDGVDIGGVSLRSLRRQIGAVTQETVLFRGTIASNIAYGAAWATRAQVEDAAKRAHAHGFIVQQREGYDTVVGDAGLTLSGGQRQRIAIARALLRDPAILIMDEATSMIDSESESQIAAAVAEMAGTRTTLIVAHRLTTVLSAQRIVVMDRGRVIDSGRHEELVERCRLYRELTRHQRGDESGKWTVESGNAR